MRIIDSKHLEEIKSRGLSSLRISAVEWDALQESRNHSNQFSLTFAHDVARNARVQSLILIESGHKDCGLRIGLVRSIHAVSTLHSRVKIDLVRPISPASLEELLRQI